MTLGKILTDVKDQWPLAFELALALHTARHDKTSSSYHATIPAGYATNELKSQVNRSSAVSLPTVWQLTEQSPSIVHLLHWLLRDSLLVFTAVASTTTTSLWPSSGAWDWKSKPYFDVRLSQSMYI